MTPYNQEEIDRINKVKETNDKLEEFFNDKRFEWNKNVEPLFKVVRVDLTNPSSAKEIMEAQSLALSYRQGISEQINFFLNKRGKETTKIKKLRQDKFIFYATGFGIKTNLGEKGILKIFNPWTPSNEYKINVKKNFFNNKTYNFTCKKSLYAYQIDDVTDNINKGNKETVGYGMKWSDTNVCTNILEAWKKSVNY